MVNQKQIVHSESAPRVLSNEGSCQYVSTIINQWGQFLCPTLDDHMFVPPVKLTCWTHPLTKKWKMVGTDTSHCIRRSIWTTPANNMRIKEYCYGPSAMSPYCSKYGIHIIIQQVTDDLQKYLGNHIIFLAIYVYSTTCSLFCSCLNLSFMVTSDYTAGRLLQRKSWQRSLVQLINELYNTCSTSFGHVDL
jgi:hypothetical protein